MNTSKSLDSTLRKLYEAGVNAANSNKVIDDIVKTDGVYGKDYKPALEAKQAIVEAVEGLAPQKMHIMGLHNNDFWYAKGFNEAVAEVLQAIKEWQ